jgi:hypothetical protein
MIRVNVIQYPVNVLIWNSLMQNPEHSQPEKEFDFKLTEPEYRLVCEALLELPGKFMYSTLKKIEKQMVDQNQKKDEAAV